MAPVPLQVEALLRKNVVYQRRNWLSNGCILLAPVAICVVLLVIQDAINGLLDTPDNRCGCLCLSCCTNVDDCVVDEGGVRTCTERKVCREASDSPCLPNTYDDCNLYDETQCGLQFSNFEQAAFCGIDHPLLFPPLQQVPAPEFRAPVPSGSIVQPAAPVPPATQLLTGQSADVVQQLSSLMYTQADVQRLTGLLTGPVPDDASIITTGIDGLTQAASRAAYMGTSGLDDLVTYHVDPAWTSDAVYYLARACASNASQDLALGSVLRTSLQCTPMALAPVADAAAINGLLYCGWEDARCSGNKETNGYASPIDFMDTGAGNLRFTYYDNYTVSASGGGGPSGLRRGNSVVALVYDTFLRWKTGGALSSRLLGIQDFPTVQTRLRLDFSSLIGPLFYTWVLQTLLPIIVLQTVDEKEHSLVVMMRMHGLSPVTYWLVQYLWYLLLHVFFVALLLIVGSAIGLNFFTLNSIGVQIVFYLLFSNTQISLGFLASTVFSSSRTAVVTTFLYVFGSGLVAGILIDTFYARNKWFNTLLYLFPPFSLYRAMWEFGEYAFRAGYTGGDGLTWASMDDPDNDLWQVMVILALQGPLFLAATWYLNSVLPGYGLQKHWLFFLPRFKQSAVASASHSGGPVGESAGATDGVELPTRASGHGVEEHAWLATADDVEEERARAMAADPLKTPIVLLDIHKAYPARGNTKPKLAVDGISFTVQPGECLGLLGPNGAGKSTTIQMMVGLQRPTAGTALIAGQDVKAGNTDMYNHMGVCPQDNLLWGQLSAEQHLLFYGRLKNLRGAALKEAVKHALHTVQLTSAARTAVQKYSGGMKRRLSVAISLIGEPQVVFLDEPSTGLDPASRQALWGAVTAAKQKSAVVLTTHSMQEAETLCDRLGIVVNGRLICLGNPRDLTGRHGAYLEFSITVPVGQVDLARQLVQKLTPTARQTYALAGTLRYDLPSGEVDVKGIFDTMHRVPAEWGLTVLDWGIANATLEDVFIKLSRGAMEAPKP